MPLKHGLRRGVGRHFDLVAQSVSLQREGASGAHEPRVVIENETLEHDSKNARIDRGVQPPAKHLDQLLLLHFNASQQEDDLNRALDALKDKNMKRIEIGIHVMIEKGAWDEGEDDSDSDGEDEDEDDE